MTSLQKTIVSLTAIRNSIERGILCLYSFQDHHLSDKPGRINDPYLIFTLQNYLLILLCSFLDEWGRFAAFAKNDKRAKTTLITVKPAIDRFRKWPDLHKIRSGLLAHSPHQKNDKVMFPWEAFSEYRCPTTPAEILLLAFCTLMVVDHMRSQFTQEQAEAEKEILIMDRVIIAQGVPDAKGLEKEFVTIQEEINKNKRAKE